MRELLLKDKVILVTGSTTGIGEYIARRCCEEGAGVMVHGRNEERARQIMDECSGDCAYVIADLSDPSSPEKMIQAVVDHYGRIDALVNNAALMTRSNIDTTDCAMFDLIIGVNLRAPLLLIRAAMPWFRKQGHGHVLNIGSVNALGGERNLLAYSTAKGGMMTMTRNLSDAHARAHIRFNQLNVGWTLTDNERQLKMDEGLPEGWEFNLPPSHAPSGRLYMPEEVAAHAAFWLSDAAGPLSGAVCEIEQYPFVGRNPHEEGTI